MGSTIRVNNVTAGSVEQGSIVKLFDNYQTVHSATASLVGQNIGSARVYSFNLEDSAYEGDTTTWELRLFDIQTHTDLILNENISAAELPAQSFVKGKNSGASGFAVGAGGGSTLITLSDTSGKFIKGEQIQINGIDFPRTVGVVTAYTTQDIKSIESPTGGGSKFKADVVNARFRLPNNVTEVIISNNGQTATAVNGSFASLRPGVILMYNKPGRETTYNKVTIVDPSGKAVGLTSCQDVPFLREGTLFTTAQGLPNSGATVQMFGAGPLVTGTGRLYAPLDNSNIESINLSDSKLKITSRLTGQNITNDQLNISKSR